MELENVKFVVVTAKSCGDDTTIAESMEDYGHKVTYWVDNKESLSTIYNIERVKAVEDDLDALIFVHDDVILNHDPIPCLCKLFGDYDLVGVAGASRVDIKSPALWHLMGSGYLHGKVWHNLNGMIRPSEFGKHPSRAVMIDGVFMALNKKAIRDMYFDDDCPSKFHFYDLISSLDFHLAGGRVGVGNISITHESPGLREFTDEWKAGEKYFLNKHGH